MWWTRLEKLQWLGERPKFLFIMGGLIEGFPQTLLTPQHYGIERLQQEAWHFRAADTSFSSLDEVILCWLLDFLIFDLGNSK